MSAPQVTAEGEAGKALAFLLRSTSARPQTEAELRAKLRAREVPDEVADEALAKARALGAVDDRAFAFAWVEDRGRVRGYGASRLRQELRRRLVPDAILDEALASLEDRDEEDAALELARRRAQRMPADLPPETVARRVMGFLVRRGYPPGVAQRAVRKATSLDREWD
ncbi:MAG TPA: regulatory protein RecX [Egibacteraceae bacterium]|nr:regulatory protein RecX [Egibacteraceae bacterium]